MNDPFRPAWLDDATLPRFAPLDRDIPVDVAVIGAGLTGLTTALILRRAGFSVALLERHHVARAATAHTSGHLTSVPDVLLGRLVSRFGEAGAREAVQAGVTAIDTIEALCAELAPEAGFRRVPALRFAAREADVPELRAETITAGRLGLRATLVDATPLPFPVAGALRVEEQALFHPLRYAAALARAFTAAGGQLFEDTPVTEVEVNSSCRVHAGGRIVGAAHVVHATQSPLGRMVSVQARLVPVTSYVLVARLTQPAPDCLAWDTAEPYHYYRPLQSGSALLVAGGCDHKTGQPDGDAFARLEAHVRGLFQVASIEKRWSFGLYEPADGLPYIGQLGDAPVYVAAGFAGAGLTFGTVAALLVRDLLAGRTTPLSELLRPTRLKPLASAGDVVRETADNAWRLVRDRLARPDATDADDVARGEGRILKVDGHKAAVHRDADGRLHVLSPVCTHLGCLVHWNAAACTWDCPCHGGRYLPDGRVLYGPPVAPLERETRAPEPAPEFLPRETGLEAGG
jgi:glycine/D-amino acid oxidase-like deaminating enzyme/nitrite reductase/ring-hydroxylating ferredoxin subunit